MTLGRCEDCRFWSRDEVDMGAPYRGREELWSDGGACKFFLEWPEEKAVAVGWEDGGRYVERTLASWITAPDFGCIMFEPKADRP